MGRFKIFVEGLDDKKFIQDYLKYIDRYSPNISIEDTGGWTKLNLAEPQFTENTFLDGINITIFDADTNFASRKAQIDRIISDNGLQTVLFLFPNNADPGNLDTLLRNISNPEYATIFNCFDSYKDCLSHTSVSYKLPTIKHDIYSYLYCVEGDPRPGKRDFLISDHWNLGSPLLDNLKTFLEDIIPPP
jgi:hypothetical protein